jgi:hypothetical protein
LQYRAVLSLNFLSFLEVAKRARVVCLGVFLRQLGVIRDEEHDLPLGTMYLDEAGPMAFHVWLCMPNSYDCTAGSRSILITGGNVGREYQEKHECGLVHDMCLCGELNSWDYIEGVRG